MENFFVKKLVGVVVAIGTSAMIILIFQNFSDSHLTVIPDLGSRQALPKEPIHEGMELVKIEPFLQLDTTVVLKTYYKIKKGWKWYRDCRINVPGVGEVDAIAYHYNSIIYSGPELNGDANWFKWVWGPKYQDCPGEYKEKYFLGQSHIKNAPRFTSDNLLELTDSQSFFYNGVDYKISLVKKKYPQICVKGGIVDKCERYSYNDSVDLFGKTFKQVVTPKWGTFSNDRFSFIGIQKAVDKKGKTIYRRPVVLGFFHFFEISPSETKIIN